MVQGRWHLLVAAVCAGLCAKVRAQAVWAGADAGASGNFNWSDPGNWLSSIAPISGGTVTFDSNATFFNPSNVDTNLSYSSVSFTTLSSDLTVTETSSGTIGINSGNAVTFDDTHNVTLNVPVTGAGGLSLAAAGQTGMVILGAHNTYTGPTTVRYGTLTDSINNAFSPNSSLDVGGNGSGTPGIVSINNDETVAGLFDAVGGPGSVVLGSEGVLTIDSSSSFSGTISGSGGSLQIAGGATFNVNSGLTYTGDTIIDVVSTLQINTGGSLSPSTQVSGLGTLAFNSSSNISVANLLEDQIGVLQEGSGITTLTNAGNLYSGPTTVNSGTLADGFPFSYSPESPILIGPSGTFLVQNEEPIASLGNSGPGNGIITIASEGQLELNGDSPGVTSALHGNGTLDLEGVALGLVGTAPNTFDGNIIVEESSSLSIGNGGLGAARITGSGDVYFVNPGNMTIQADLGTSGEDVFGVHQTGSGTTTFSPEDSNVYTGLTHVNAGTLADGESHSFSQNSVVLLSGGGTLQSNFDETIAGLGDDGGGSEFVAIASGATLTLNLTDNTGAQSFSGVISGAGILKVDGDGTNIQTLTGQNTYTGGTIVANSQLNLVGGAINHPTGDLVVGGTLENTGILSLSSGAVVTDANGIIGNQSGEAGTVNLTDPTDQWNSQNTLTVGNSGNGTLTMSNGQVNDAIAVVGSLSGSIGAVEIDAGTWTTLGQLTVGNSGNGTLKIFSGQVSDANAVVGSLTGSLGLVEVNGGNWSTSGSVTVGSSGEGAVNLAFPGTLSVGGGSGTLTLGTATAGALLAIGTNDDAGLNQGGILDVAAINGTAGNFTSDNLLFNTDTTSSSPYYFTSNGLSGGTPINIEGAIHVEIVSGATVLSNASSTYGGGTTVDGAGMLILGASSVGGAPDNPASGPVGIAPLTFGDGGSMGMSANNLTLANTLVVNTDGSLSVGSGSSYDLNLTGTIHGGAELDWDSTGTLTLSKNTSDFNGGLLVNDGTLNLTASTIGGDVDTDPASGPAGTSQILFGDGTFLTRPAGATITLSNSIVILDDGFPAQMTISGDPTGLYVFSGVLSDFTSQGRLNIDSPVDIEGLDEVSRTVVTGTTLIVGNDLGVASTDLFAAAGSTVNFTSQNPTIESMSVISSVVNFQADSGEPFIESLAMTGGTINFGAESSPEILSMVSDSPGSTNVMNLPDSDTVLSFDTSSSSPIKYYGAINGFGNLDIGSGDEGTVLQLNGNNTYTGTTTIESGNLGIAGSNSAFGGYQGTAGTLTLVNGSALVVNSGVTLSNEINIPDDGGFIGGYGTLAPASPQGITIQNGSTIAGGTGTLAGTYTSGLTGNAVGALTFGPTETVTLAQGGVLQFSVMNAAGTPGTDYSAINVTGTLVIDSSTATTPFTIQVIGIDGVGPYDGSNTANSFNFGAAHTWTLLSAGSITDPSGGFNPADFTVDLGDLNGVGPGTWAVSQVGENLDLNFSPVPEPSTWALMGYGLGASALIALRRRRAAPVL